MASLQYHDAASITKQVNMTLYARLQNMTLQLFFGEPSVLIYRTADSLHVP